MKVVKEAISSDYLSYKVDEDMVIYEGNFCIYLDKLYKCKGLIYYKISPPTLISFEAKVIGRQGKDLENIKDEYLEDKLEPVRIYAQERLNYNCIGEDGEVLKLTDEQLEEIKNKAKNKAMNDKMKGIIPIKEG